VPVESPAQTGSRHYHSYIPYHGGYISTVGTGRSLTVLDVANIVDEALICRQHSSYGDCEG